MRRLHSSLLIAAMVASAFPAHGQTRAARPVSTRPTVITQSVMVPVYPGQMLTATLSLPTLEETPLPAVLVLTVREPASAPVAAATALERELLERGFAVVHLELPPLPADAPPDSEPMLQPADDAFAVLQFVREREDIDGDRVGVVGIGDAAEHAARATALDEAARALVLLGAQELEVDTMGLPTDLPLLSLPVDVRAAPPAGAQASSPATDAAVFFARHLQ